MTKKRILYIGGFQLPDKNAAAHRVLGIGKSIRDAGYTVVYLDVSDDILTGEISETWECMGFEVYSQRHSHNTFERIQYSLSPTHVEEVLDKYSDWHAVIAYNYPAISLLKLKMICKNRDILLLADCTEWYAFEPKTFGGLMAFIDSEIRMRVIQKRLDGLIVISKYLRSYYEKHVPCIVIPPTVDLTEEKWSQVSGKNSEDDGKISLIYAGSPGREKDLLNMIVSAISSVERKIQLNVVGITYDEYCKLFGTNDLLNKMVSEKKIVFEGRLSHKETLKKLQSCDYSIFYRENNRVTMAGFPTKFVESISCKVPVLTTESSDLRDYVQTAFVNGIILSRDNFEKELELTLKQNRRITVQHDLFHFSKYTQLIKEFMGEIDGK